MNGVVSRVISERVIKAFFLEAHVVPSRDTVGATRQAKLSTSVKAAWGYDVPIPERSEITATQTDRHTESVLLRSTVVLRRWGRFKMAACT